MKLLIILSIIVTLRSAVLAKGPTPDEIIAEGQKTFGEAVTHANATIAAIVDILGPDDGPETKPSLDEVISDCLQKGQKEVGHLVEVMKRNDGDRAQKEGRKTIKALKKILREDNQKLERIAKAPTTSLKKRYAIHKECRSLHRTASDDLQPFYDLIETIE